MNHSRYWSHFFIWQRRNFSRRPARSPQTVPQPGSCNLSQNNVWWGFASSKKLFCLFLLKSYFSQYYVYTYLLPLEFCQLLWSYPPRLTFATCGYSCNQVYNPVVTYKIKCRCFLTWGPFISFFFFFAIFITTFGFVHLLSNGKLLVIRPQSLFYLSSVLQITFQWTR